MDGWIGGVLQYVGMSEQSSSQHKLNRYTVVVFHSQLGGANGSVPTRIAEDSGSNYRPGYKFSPKTNNIGPTGRSVRKLSVH